MEIIEGEASALDAAKSLVYGDRQSAYGTPLDDFTVQAEFWTTYLRGKGYLKEGVALEPECVPEMFILTKIARQLHRRKFDNPTDIAGYAETIVMTERERKRRLRK